MSRDYTKKDIHQLENLIRCVQADPKHMTLLQILGEQLELLVIKGKPDIQLLLESLVAESLVSEHEHREIASEFRSQLVGRRLEAS